MNLTVKLAGALALAIAFFGPAAARSPAQDSAAWRVTQAAFEPDDRLYRSCRRKIRRELGPARGRHTASLRIAFAHRCVASGGKSW